jgi:hypothetical protein
MARNSFAKTGEGCDRDRRAVECVAEFVEGVPLADQVGVRGTVLSLKNE